MVSGEPDFTKRVNVYLADAIIGIDHKKIKGEDLQDPTFANCVPCSIENDAIAYDAVNDRFKVDIEAMAVGAIDIGDPCSGTQTNDIKVTLDGETVDISDRAARDLGKVDIAAFDVSLPAGSNLIGEVNINDISKGTQTNDVKVTLDGETVNVSDRAARDLGKVDIAAFDVALPAGSNLIGEIDINDISKGTQTNDVKVTLDGETVTVAQSANVDIGDISAGTQTNDVKVTLDGEAVVLGAGSADIGDVNVDDPCKGTQTNDIHVETEHDRVTYKTAYARITADGNIIAGVAGKVIKVHSISIQAHDDVEFGIEDESGGSTIDYWELDDREGSNIPFHPYPSYYLVTAQSGALYCDFVTAGNVKFTVVYTDHDTS